MEPEPIPGQSGMNNEKMSSFDLESAELSPETLQTLQCVQTKYPDMVVEALIAQRDPGFGRNYESTIGEDDEAILVWRALENFLNVNAGAADIWLSERVPLDELMREQSGRAEDFDAEEHLKREIPYIRKALAENPITLLDLVQGVKTQAVEIEKLSVLPEDARTRINGTVDRLVEDQAQSEREAAELLKRLQEK